MYPTLETLMQYSLLNQKDTQMSDITPVFDDDQAFVDYVYLTLTDYQKTLIEHATTKAPAQNTYVQLTLTYNDLVAHTGRKACRKAFINDIVRRLEEHALVVVFFDHPKRIQITLPSIEKETVFMSLPDIAGAI